MTQNDKDDIIIILMGIMLNSLIIIFFWLFYMDFFNWIPFEKQVIVCFGFIAFSNLITFLLLMKLSNKMQQRDKIETEI